MKQTEEDSLKRTTPAAARREAKERERRLEFGRNLMADMARRAAEIRRESNGRNAGEPEPAEREREPEKDGRRRRRRRTG